MLESDDIDASDGCRVKNDTHICGIDSLKALNLNYQSINELISK